MRRRVVRRSLPTNDNDRLQRRRILAGFVTSLRVRRIQTRAERLAWLIVLATIPVGLAGLALEHLFRSTLGKPIPAAVFLIVNGGILLGGERLRRRPLRP